jgi:hypothetical protein
VGSSAPSMATVSGTSETTSGCDCVDIVYLREREADYCAGMSGERREGTQAPSVFVSGFRAPTDFRESGAEAATPRQCSSDGAILSTTYQHCCATKCKACFGKLEETRLCCSPKEAAFVLNERTNERTNGKVWKRKMTLLVGSAVVLL